MSGRSLSRIAKHFLDFARISAETPIRERRRRVLDIMLAVIILGAAATLADLAGYVLLSSPYIYTSEYITLLLGSLFAIGVFSGIALVNRYRPGRLPGALFLFLLVIVVSISDTPEQIVAGRSLFFFTIPIVIAGAIMPPRTTFLAALLCTLTISLISLLMGGTPSFPAILGFFVLACVTWIWGRGLEDAAEARRRSEDRYRLLAESAKDVIWTLDMDMHFTYASPSIEDLLGLAPQEILGEPLDRIVTHESALLIQRVISDLLTSGASPTSGCHGSVPLELEGCRKDGSVLWLEVSTAVDRDTVGKPVGIHGVVRDISERRFAARELEGAVARAEFYNDLMAHDLSNMHQAIALSLELLLEDRRINSGAQSIVQDALSQTKRSIELAGNVRRHARLCREPKNLSALDLYEPIHSAIQAVQAAFPKKNIVVNNNIPPNTCHVMADEFAVDLFFNLLHNSAKADIHETVTVDILTEVSANTRTLTVHIDDRGPGIDRELRERLMSEQEDRDAGRGLGFLLAKKIAERYDGSVTILDRVEGNTDQGTRISVRFVLAPDQIHRVAVGQ